MFIAIVESLLFYILKKENIKKNNNKLSFY